MMISRTSATWDTMEYQSAFCWIPKGPGHSAPCNLEADDNCTGRGNLGSTVPHREPENSGRQIRFAKKPPPFHNIKSLEMNLSGISMNVLSKLLQEVKNLESFSFRSSSTTIVDFPRLNRALLRCSRASLQKLVLHDDAENQHYLSRLINFQNLIELKINVSFLLDHQEEPQRRSEAIDTRAADIPSRADTLLGRYC